VVLSSDRGCGPVIMVLRAMTHLKRLPTTRSNPWRFLSMNTPICDQSEESSASAMMTIRRAFNAFHRRPAITFCRLMDDAGALRDLDRVEPLFSPSIPSARKQYNAVRTQTPMVRTPLRYGMTAVKNDAFIRIPRGKSTDAGPGSCSPQTTATPRCWREPNSSRPSRPAATSTAGSIPGSLSVC
jgi:hypothetical protein